MDPLELHRRALVIDSHNDSIVASVSCGSGLGSAPPSHAGAGTIAQLQGALHGPREGEHAQLNLQRMRDGGIDAATGEQPAGTELDAAAVVASAGRGAPDAVFDFGPLPSSAVTTRGIGWRTPRREIDWVWDHDTTRWLRFHRGAPLLDETGVQLAADNVLVLYLSLIHI